MSKENKFKDIPYAEWLEEALRDLLNFPAKGLCIIATNDSGDVYTSYYDVAINDKLLIAGVVQQDALLDTLIANGYIQKSSENDEEDEDD